MGCIDVIMTCTTEVGPLTIVRSRETESSETVNKSDKITKLLLIEITGERGRPKLSVIMWLKKGCEFSNLLNFN